METCIVSGCEATQGRIDQMCDEHFAAWESYADAHELGDDQRAQDLWLDSPAAIAAALDVIREMAAEARS